MEFKSVHLFTHFHFFKMNIEAEIQQISPESAAALQVQTGD